MFVCGVTVMLLCVGGEGGGVRGRRARSVGTGVCVCVWGGVGRVAIDLHCLVQDTDCKSM